MRRYTNEQLEEIASVELEKAKKYKGLYNKDLINIDEEDLKAMSSSFGGGISRLREVCGCISGMALVMGYLKGRYNDDIGKAKHYQLIQELSLKFKEKFNSINCATLLISFFIFFTIQPAQLWVGFLSFHFST